MGPITFEKRGNSCRKGGRLSDKKKKRDPTEREEEKKRKNGNKRRREETEKRGGGTLCSRGCLKVIVFAWLKHHYPIPSP